ncbi:MAG: hypothetical protein WC889_11585, partial [Myxococcota bacterium]
MNDQLLNKLGSGSRVRVSGVSPQAAAFVVAGLFGHQAGDPDAPLYVLVVPDNEAMDRLASDLRFFLGLKADPPDVHTYPADEVNPFSGVSPDRADVASRLGVLHRLMRGEPVRVLVVSAPALLKKVMPRELLASAGDYVIPGVEVDRERLVQNLLKGGYLRAPVVDGPGQFAARGGIVDIFSPLHDHPVRLEFLGDLVDRMRFFEPESQRTFRDAPEIYAPPVSELVLQEGSRELAASELQAEGERLCTPSRRLSEAVEEVLSAESWSYPAAMLPAFYRKMSTISDYLKESGRTVRLLAFEPERALEEMKGFLDQARADLLAARQQRTPVADSDRHYADIDAAAALFGGAAAFSLIPS